MAHFIALQDPLLKPSLEDPRNADAKLVQALQDDGFRTAGTVLSSLCMRVNARAVSVGDVVLFCMGGSLDDICVGEVYFHACVDGECITCISNWPIVENAKHYKKVVVRDEPCTMPSAWVLQSVIVAKPGAGKKSTVLLPCEYR